MKTFKNTLKITITSMALFVTSFSYGITYTSLIDGEWNNTTDVWSTDGITPCGCFPGYNINNVEIIVKTNITTTGDLKFANGSSLTINSGCSLGANYNVILQGSVLNVFGDLMVKKLTQNTGSSVNIFGGTLTLSNKYDLMAGVLNMDHGNINFVGAGNFEVADGGEVNVMNGSFIEVAYGNVLNNGTINIDITSCVSSSGTWWNLATGIVSGNGSTWSTLGTMKNENIWDPLIVWCSFGSEVGMPSPEDCSEENNICIAAILPVELVSLKASALDDNSANITWATASERNSAYFKLMKLVVGQDWKEIDRVTAAENSSTLRNYSSIDSDFNIGDVYYRLIQVDLNGLTFYSDVVSVTFDETSSGAFLYPNPIQKSEVLTISNLSDEHSVISIMSVASNLTIEKVGLSVNGTVNLSMEKFQSGLYFVKVEQQSGSKTIKLMVTK